MLSFRMLISMGVVAFSLVSIDVSHAECTQKNQPNSVRDELRRTGNTATYGSDAIVDTISFVSHVSHSDLDLIIWLEAYSKYEIRSAPELQKAPANAINTAIGCSDETLGALIPDKDKSTSTGKYIWKQSPRSICEHEISIVWKNGATKSQTVRCREPASHYISLKEEVLNNRIHYEDSVEIKCETCRILRRDSPDSEGSPSPQEPKVISILNMRNAIEEELQKVSDERKKQQALEEAIRQERGNKKLADERKRKEAKEQVAKEQERTRKKSIKEQLLNL